jgi:hypothetical protein
MTFRGLGSVHPLSLAGLDACVVVTGHTDRLGTVNLTLK